MLRASLGAAAALRRSTLIVTLFLLLGAVINYFYFAGLSGEELTLEILVATIPAFVIAFVQPRTLLGTAVFSIVILNLLLMGNFLPPRFVARIPNSMIFWNTSTDKTDKKKE